MSFVNTQYLPHIIGASVFLAIVFTILNNRYFRWVKTYWFFERSWMSRLSATFYMLSIFLMLASLLDLRGPEQKVKADLPDQKTIIILDSSSSMLAEDVRPSRFGKALQIARHFVKNSPGHQISVVLFSDVQKRLIPFTDDVDLLDSRIAALEKTNAVSGGSNISQAIAESAQYFESDGEKNSASGNILVLTDAEESENAFDLELGNNINLAVVGIGTASGGSIPLRWEDGSFQGYKKFKGEVVTTKLDENYIKSIGKNVKNYKYWIANSYSLPTDEIRDFFRSSYGKSQGKGDMRVRPVFSHLILIPAILIYCLSVLLGRFPSFKKVLSLVVILGGLSLNVFGEEEQEKPQEKPKEIPVAIKKDMQRMKEGKADRKEILKIAEKLLKSDDGKRANEIYSEYAQKTDDDEVIFNQATALLKENRLNEAIPLISDLMKRSKNESLKDKLRSNILAGLKNSQEQQKKEDQKKDQKNDQKKDEKDQKENKDNKKGDKEDKNQKDGNNDKDGKDGKGKDQDQKKDSKENDSKDKDKEKNKKPEPKDLEKPGDKEQPQSMEEKEKMIEQKRKMVKTPAMIKQIMNDDRDLQKRMMDTSTKERGKQKEKRDW